MKPQRAVALDSQDRAVVNALQDGFPICPEPFDEAARGLGMNGADVMGRVGRLLDEGVLSRFGPMFDAAAMGGGFSLCAMAVPEDDFERIVDLVNGFDQVAHNYARDHALNMWFVIGSDDSNEIRAVIDAIEKVTGLPVYDFPKEEEYRVRARFEA